jgi:hypothetical protein
MKVQRDFRTATLEKDACLIFNSQILPVSSNLFSCFSGKFKRDLRDAKKQLSVNTTADLDTVIQFVNACQLQTYSISLENALPLLSLAEEWEVQPLEEAVIEFMGRPENSVPLLIPTILRDLSRNADTSALETQLRPHIPSLLEGDSLLQLPVSLVSRLLDSDSPLDLRRLFPFLVRCLNHFGPTASALFCGIEVDQLTPEEIGTLQSHPDFRWCFLGPSVGSAILNLVGENSKQGFLLSSQVSRIEIMGSTLENFLNEVRERCEAMESSLRTGLDNLRSEMNSRVECRLREEVGSLKLSLESTIQGEIVGANSKLDLAVAAIRDEIQKESAATDSRLKSVIQSQCDGVSSSIRTELQQERAAVRQALGWTYIPHREASLDGIIAFLRRRFGGNLVAKKIVAAGPGVNPDGAFDFDGPKSFYHHTLEASGSSQYLAIDFKQMRIQITHYSLQVPARNESCVPKSWLLEGSADGNAWFILDTKTDRPELKDMTQAHTFSIANPRYCRHVRFRKTEGWHASCSRLFIAAIEFFGYLSGLS